jgi:tubulin-specific chaperone C
VLHDQPVDDNMEPNDLINGKESDFAQNFWKSFTLDVAAMRNDMKDLKPNCAPDLEKIVFLKNRWSELQISATEATPMLPAYDVRRTQEELETLSRELRDTEAALKPKKKFAFAARTKQSIPQAPGVTDNAVEKTQAPPSVVTSVAAGIPDGSYVVADKKDTVDMLSSELLKSCGRNGLNVQLLLRDCEGLQLSAPSLLGSVRLEGIRNSFVFLGPCCTSVYLENCTDCTVFIACHQLRIHTSHRCNLYVMVNSHPIIEDCSDMSFAPYSAMYDGIERDVEMSGLQDAKCWDNVIDFRWHRSTPSPHWSRIPALSRITAIPEKLSESGWKISTEKANPGDNNADENSGHLNNNANDQVVHAVKAEGSEKLVSKADSEKGLPAAVDSNASHSHSHSVNVDDDEDEL